MSLNHSPSVVTNGLVVFLDVANSKSYGPSSVEVLVVGGGGGGGGSYGAGGGGGAGGLVYHPNKTITPGSAISVVVGAGGQGGRYYAASTTGNYGTTNNSHGFAGGNSSFSDIIALGGGGGNEAFYTDSVYKNGGSGGGAGDYYFGVANPGASRGGLATQTNSGGGYGYGYPGGSRGPGGPTTAEDTSHAPPHEGSGGGGAGGVATGGDVSLASNGGIGKEFPQFSNAGSPPGWFAGGGGGGFYAYGPFTPTNAPGSNTGAKGGGGRGRDGASTDATVGVANTGGGGGGGSGNNTSPHAPDGGSGIVIIKYPGPQKATGGTITTVGGSTIHTFTTSGTFTPAGANTLHDLSGNGYSGAITNGPTYNSSNGGSLVFTGTSTQINTSLMGTWVPDGSVGYSTMTIDIWVKLTSTAGWIYTRPFNGSGQYNVWITPAYFWINAISGASQINFARNIYDGTWTNITCWANSTQMGYYINGGQYSDSKAHGITGGVPSAGNYVNSSLMSWLYAYGAGDTHTDCAAGNLSSFKFYSRVLTAAEVKQNFNAHRGRYGI